MGGRAPSLSVCLKPPTCRARPPQGGHHTEDSCHFPCRNDPLRLSIQDPLAWPLPELSQLTQHIDKPLSPAGTGHQARCPVPQAHAHSACAHAAHTGTADASQRPQGPPPSRHVSTAARPGKIKANPGATSFLQEHHLGLFISQKGILLKPLKTLLRAAYNHTWLPKDVSVSDVTFSTKQQNPHHWDSQEEKRHPWTVREGQVTPGFPAIHPGGHGRRLPPRNPRSPGDRCAAPEAVSQPHSGSFTHHIRPRLPLQSPAIPRSRVNFNTRMVCVAVTKGAQSVYVCTYSLKTKII